MTIIQEAESPTHLPLGRRIAEMLAERGDAFSIRAFSSRIGISREIIRKMLSGERYIAPSELNRIARGLSVSVERLKQTDTQAKRSELERFFKARKFTKPTMLWAQSVATELTEVALGATERGESLNNLGKVVFLQQNYEAAHRSWLQALEYAETIYHQHHDAGLLHAVTANLMLTYSLRKEYSRIEDVLQITERAFAEDVEVMGQVEYTRMKVQEERGAIEQARVHAYRSYEFFEQTQNRRQISHASINTAHYEYLLGNYAASARILSDAIDTSKPFEDILIRVVKEYVKSLIQLREYEKATRVIDVFEALAAEHPEIQSKLQIMKSTATGNPSFAEVIANDVGRGQAVRFYASRCLIE
ncbi:MAG TPA: helix-turn-helix transcriptional regulator, partial [Bacilli bacterium]|nr:helix-turn-helix transcriptional regulator [Bacilli bacterium]